MGMPDIAISEVVKTAFNESLNGWYTEPKTDGVNSGDNSSVLFNNERDLFEKLTDPNEAYVENPDLQDD